MSEEKVIEKKKRICETIDDIIARTDKNVLENNTLLRRLKKEFLYPDAAAALGEYNTEAIEAARHAAVARKVAWVVETDQPKVRFPRFVKGYPVKREPGQTSTIAAGSKITYVDVDVDIEAYAEQVVDRVTVEDTPASILRRLGPQLVEDVYYQETSDLIAVLDTISSSNLAGGAAQSPSSAGAFQYVDFLTLLSALEGEGWNPGIRKTLLFNPAQFYDKLASDDKFINSNYQTATLDPETGALGRIFNTQFIPTGAVTAGTVYLLTWFAVGMPLRRDATIETFEEKNGVTVYASSRYGMKVLVTKAVAKMTGA
ncbi:MAG: hypothetical protein QW761_02330 [Candidatus Aenigmatarchaeota archaeon]